MKFEVNFIWWLASGFGVALLLTLLLGRPVVNFIADAFVKRLLQDPYPENLAEMYNVFTKVGFQNVLEADLRTNNGLPLERPFGSPEHFSPWHQLLLNPVYMVRPPIVESYPINMNVLLGPKAKRPMEINLPIVFGGMAYGLGPSRQVKLAMAKAASMAGTATNTGVGPFLVEERKLAEKLIIQYHRGAWTKDEVVLRQADMVEIQLGYGALGSAPVTLAPEHISQEFREFMKLGSEDSLHLGATLPGVSDVKGLKRLVQQLRELTNGAPIGVKFGATHYLESELEIITAAGVDFVSIDGAEAGINFGPPLLADSTGLPTLAALCRARRFLLAHRLEQKISLIISGGLSTPGHFLKALALGADAVAVGTVVMLVVAHPQISKVLPWEPPTELVFERGKSKQKLKVDEAAQCLANYLQSCRAEMILGMRAMGRTALQQLSPGDLCALSPEVAGLTGVELGLVAPRST